MELFSGAATALGVFALSSSYALRCKFTECCGDDWIGYDETSIVYFKFTLLYFDLSYFLHQVLFFK